MKYIFICVYRDDKSNMSQIYNAVDYKDACLQFKSGKEKQNPTMMNNILLFLACYDNWICYKIENFTLISEGSIGYLTTKNFFNSLPNKRGGDSHQ